MKAKIRGTEIYFDIEGLGLRPTQTQMEEYPTAFLVHGGPGADHSAYKPLFSGLTDCLQLLYFDHRGQGRSARGDKTQYTLEQNVEDMEALRDYLGLEQIVVIGASYGGMVSLSYASRYPQRVKALVVMATAGHYSFLEQAKQNLQHKGTPEQNAIAEYLWQGRFRDEEHLGEYFKIMGSLYALNYDPSSSANAFQKTILSVEPINIAFSTFLRQLNLLPEIQRITAPTLVIGAKDDWICPPEFSQQIADNIPDATLKIFEECGHLIRIDQPQILIQEIGNFLTQI